MGGVLVAYQLLVLAPKNLQASG